MIAKDCSSCPNSANGSCPLKKLTGRMMESLEPRRLMATNYIIAENQLGGTPQSTWDVSSQDTTIMGFATDISVDQGQTISFKINDTARVAYHIDIYRMGYYQGNGARKVATIASSATLKTAQPAALTNSTTGLIDAGNWSVTASWAVPTNAVSGIYFGKVIRDDTGGASLIYFVVRDDDGQSDMMFKTSDATWQAYNDWGGNSLYVGSSALNPVGSFYPRAVKVSYNRPLSLRDTYGGLGSFNDPMFAEYPMVRFLERNGYNISYTTDIDTDRRGSELLEHSAFLSVGHDEYWSLAERNAMEAARDAGVDMAFFSGNEGYWKVRYENSIDSSGTAYRTLVCYKETHAQAKTDPLSGVWTGQWRDPRFGPHDGGRPENGLTGQIFAVNRDSVEIGTAIQVPGSYGNLRLWRNTSIASLASNQTATLSDKTLGYEWDEAVDNAFRPSGLFNLSQTVHNVPQKLIDTYSGFGAPCPNCAGVVGAGCGCVVGVDQATHNLSLYRAGSGAMVFGAGTVQWSWGLDGTHIDGASTPDVRMQQATVNLFADMGVQPGTLMSGLVAASQSTDATAPTAVITTNLASANPRVGNAFSIAGTATDAGGGVVAGVEISTDGGKNWHPATGRTSWTYSWIPAVGGAVNIRVRAVDDSGNIQAAYASANTTVIGPSGLTGLPDTPPIDYNDTDSGAFNGIETGMKFTVDVAGTITGIRFYKGQYNTGTHVGNLWTASGTKLATVTFTNEGTTGWQAAAFSSPVSVSANTTYVVSYYAPNGHYNSDEGYFLYRTPTAGPVRPLAETTSVGNGVYKYGASGFPNGSYQATNFYVDVFFQPAVVDNTPPTVTNNTPANGATNVPNTTAVTVTFSESINFSTLSFVLKNSSNVTIPGTVTYNDTTKTATFTPTSTLASSTTFTATVTASDLAGNPLAAAKVWSFTTAVDTVPPGVTTVSPSNGSTGVAFGTPITATFNETVKSGASDIVFTLNNGSVSIAGTWSYNNSTRTVTFTPSSSLSYSTTYTASVTATDVSGNAMTAPFTWSFTTVALPTGSFGLWASNATPALAAENDSNAIEVGVKFTSDVPGVVTGLRFYKGPGNTGTHIGNLWTSTGTRLGTATFSNESSSGWQQVTFTTPVTITPGTLYVASYFAPNGHYAVDPFYFADSGVDNLTLHSPKDGVNGGNGVYLYTAASAFPNLTYNSENYWVDVLFQASNPDTTPPTVTSTSPATGATGVSQSATVAATFSESINQATISFVLKDASNNTVAGTTTYDNTTKVATFTPTSQLNPSTVYTATVTAADLAGNAMTSAKVWSFTTIADTTAPTVTARTPASGATGVSTTIKPTATFSEAINAATLVFTLKNPSNVTVPATASYDSASRTATLTPSAALPGGVTYTASVSVSDVAGNAMSAVVWTFTTSAPDLTPPSVTGRSPASGATNVALASTVTATFNEDVLSTAGAIVFTLTNTSNSSSVAGVISYNSGTRTATFTPSASLAYGTTYQASVRATDLSGNTMASPTTWSFTTLPMPSGPITVFPTTAVPAVTADPDGAAVELGMKFRTDVAGTVSGVRFYKGSGNTGTHIGTLWSSTGTKLTSRNFSGETTSGWQQVNFTTPVSISANTVYVVSYFAPRGHYASNDGYFAAAGADNGVLHALQDGVSGGNGVYRYGSSSGFPSSTYAATNYWVDVVFTASAQVQSIATTPPPPTQSQTTPFSNTLIRDILTEL